MEEIIKKEKTIKKKQKTMDEDFAERKKRLEDYLKKHLSYLNK